MKRSFVFTALIMLGIAASSAGCGSAVGPAVNIWVSSVNRENTGMAEALAPQEPLRFSSAQENNGFTVSVDTTKKYQQMDGFGASFTDASAWLVMKTLDEGARNDLMKRLFDKDAGIGISMLRQPIGACDHVLAPYTYCNEPDSNELPNFTIAHDEEYIIPAIRQAMAFHPGRISVMAATWSPPGWMKANGVELGARFGEKGTLLPDKYTAYANYLVKFILAYEKAGIPVFATSIQNEPMYASTQWPAMLLLPKEEAAFIRENLAPALIKNNLKTKIICYDHNFDFGVPYVSAVMKDPEAAKLVAGSAWHWYGGSPKDMTKIHDLYPDKGIWFTEGSGGEWDPVRRWHDGFNTQMKYVVSLPRNWSRCVVWWNIALDEKSGPDYYYNKYMGTDSTCRGLVTVNRQAGAIEYNADYYTLGHVSKFVDPGAYRIDSNTYDGKLENVAFQNPDGSVVLVAYNPSGADVPFTVKADGQSFAYTLKAYQAATFKWGGKP